MDRDGKCSMWTEWRKVEPPAAKAEAAEAAAEEGGGGAAAAASAGAAEADSSTAARLKALEDMMAAAAAREAALQARLDEQRTRADEAERQLNALKVMVAGREGDGDFVQVG